MKKILLSVIALFAAVSMNAQTAVNDDPSYFNLDKSSGWGGKWFDLKDADGNLNYDASAYEYAWIKFSGNTGKFRFGLTYSEWKSTEAWGETYFDAMNVIEDAEGISFIKLEKEKTYEFGGPDKAASPYAGDTWDKHLRQIWTQDDGTEVSVTVEGVYFGTAAELKAALGGGSSEGGEEGGSEGGEETIEGLGTAFNVENNLGLDSENGTALTAGTELASNEFVTITTGADDTYKPQEVAFKINGGDVFKAVSRVVLTRRMLTVHLQTLHSALLLAAHSWLSKQRRTVSCTLSTRLLLTRLTPYSRKAQLLVTSSLLRETLLQTSVLFTSSSLRAKVSSMRLFCLSTGLSRSSWRLQTLTSMLHT